jgi:hypothetical protein
LERNLKIAGIWEVLTRFKDLCTRLGWETSENEDWIEVRNSYHNFVSARDIHPSSFERIANSNKCVVREGLKYRVVECSYTAWLFSKLPSETVARTVLANHALSCKTALYDLSNVLDGKNVCHKLNGTDSPVFREFESFLENELEIVFKPISLTSDHPASSDDCAVTELA